MTPQEIARKIDHTLLKPEATESDIRRLCQEARAHEFFAVCVNSRFVSLCAQELRGSSVKVAAVVGFPLGAMDTLSKAAEAARAVEAGANEIDMVISIGGLKEKNWPFVAEDIRSVIRASGSARVKVILETALLTTEEKRRACEICRDEGAAFVKTSTGFVPGGATVDDIQLMKGAVDGRCEIKASGGIRSLESALAMIEAGATRLGTSSGVLLVQGLHSSGGY